MNQSVFLFILLLQSCIAAGFCRRLLVEKSYPKHKIDNWTIAGFCFGVLALIAAAGLPDRTLSRKVSDEPGRSILDRLPRMSDTWDEQ